MLDQNTALNKKIPVSFCQGDLRLGRGQGGRDESLRSLHLPSAAFGKKIYLRGRTEDKKEEGQREREREVEGKRRLGWGEMMVEVARSCREQRASRSLEGG